MRILAESTMNDASTGATVFWSVLWFVIFAGVAVYLWVDMAPHADSIPSRIVVYGFVAAVALVALLGPVNLIWFSAA